MNRILTKKFRNLVLILIGVFILLFIFRLGYGYTLNVQSETKQEVYFDSFAGDKRNFASNDYKMGMDKMGGYEYQNETTSTGTAVDQKYEKIAEVKSETHEFDKDEAHVRSQVEAFNGIIQYEKKYGNEGDRKLQLQIGVPPEFFDTLYQKMIHVGITHFKQIVKNDKTNEYLELNAKKASLEKTHSSLIAFKEKGGRIDEYVNLENRILEIEEKLQNLGVNLGDFDKSNEFCTLKIALSETKKAKLKIISFYHRSKVALEWTLAWFLRVVSITFFILLAAFLGVLILEKKPVQLIRNFIKERFSRGNKQDDSK